MELTLRIFLIVCPLTFLAGFIDAIGGGGGLISLPAMMMAGVPAHMAIATNKFGACMGTAVSAFRFAKEKLVNWKITIPGIVIAMIGSTVGAHISLTLPENLIQNLLIIVLPVVAFIVMNKHIFHDNPGDEEMTTAMMIKVAIAIFIIGIYDGIYGPGTGTFLIIAFTIFGKMSMAQANGNCKMINLATNAAALRVYLTSGLVIVPLALAAAGCNMLGNFIGSGMVMKQGSKIVKPIILVVITIFMIRLIMDLF